MSKPISLRAHTEGSLNGTFKSQRERILDLLMRQGPMTNRMIGHILRMELGAVSARVNALMEGDNPQVIESHHAPCPHTGNRVRWVAIAWPQRQLGLL